MTGKAPPALADRQCSATVAHGFSFLACGRAPSVERDGKAWCSTHDPVRAKERQHARNAITKLDDALRAAYAAIGKARAAAADYVRDNDADGITRAGAIEHGKAIRRAEQVAANAERALAEAGGKPSAFTADVRRRAGA